MSVPAFSVVFLIAFVLRAVWIALIDVVPISDSEVYHILATNIVEHGVYGFEPDVPSAYWAVGAAAIYAGSYMIFGIGPVAVIVVNLLSTAIILWGIWDLGRRWFGETEARIATLLFALWPLTIQYTTVLASELPFMALMLLGLMAWDRARKGASFWVWTLAAGLAFAGATYVRPIALLLPVILALGALLKIPRHAFRPLFKAAITTGLIFLCISPWSARNERVFGEPVMISTNFWPNMWIGNAPGGNGEYRDLPPEVAGMTEIERSDYLKSVIQPIIQEDPAGFALHVVKKALRLHNRETIGVAWNEGEIAALVGGTGVTLLKAVSTGWWFLMLGLGLVGAVLVARRIGFWSALLSPPVWLWGYLTGVHAVILIGDRFHMPAIPLIALLAAVTLAGVRRTS